MNQFGPPSPTKEEHKLDPTAIVMKPKKAKLYFNKDGTYRPPPKVPSKHFTSTILVALPLHHLHTRPESDPFSFTAPCADTHTCPLFFGSSSSSLSFAFIPQWYQPGMHWFEGWFAKKEERVNPNMLQVHPSVVFEAVSHPYPPPRPGGMIPRYEDETYGKVTPTYWSCVLCSIVPRTLILTLTLTLTLSSILSPANPPVFRCHCTAQPVPIVYKNKGKPIEKSKKKRNVEHKQMSHEEWVKAGKPEWDEEKAQKEAEEEEINAARAKKGLPPIGKGKGKGEKKKNMFGF
jgi:hypothetical protein